MVVVQGLGRLLMGVSIKVDPFDRDIDVLISNLLSPKAQSTELARFARRELESGQERNRAALGYLPTHETTVDQKRGAPLESVRPDGTIIFEFALIETLLDFVGEMLIRHSPVKTGQFQGSFALFADGVAVEPGSIPQGAAEYAFINTQPYARKIERGLSPQAPEGVMHVVSVLANRRYGNIATARFGYRSLPSGAIGAWAGARSAQALAKRIRGGSERLHPEWLTRQPAIIILPGR